MTVKVTVRNRVEIDVVAILDFLVVTAVGMLQRRTAKGIDADGNPFSPYSNLYSLQLRSVGERDNVDLTRSGAYLAGIGERSRSLDANGNARATIGPGTGTSPGMPLPPPFVFSESKTPEQRAEAFADWKASPKTKRPSPAHNVLARYISVKFKHLGLSPDEQKRLAAQAVKIALKQKR